MKKRGFWATGLMVLVVFFVSFSAWAVPPVINYQGKLTNPDGAPLNGNFVMIFHVHNAVENGGEPLWSDEYAVDVTGGIYNVQLGSANPFPEGLFENEELYLEVEIWNPDPEPGSLEKLSPRQRLTSTAFAMKAGDADTLDGLDSWQFVNRNQGFMEANNDSVVLGITNSGTGMGLIAETSGNIAVRGESTGAGGAGVAGYCYSTNGAGVFGQGDDKGVYGFCTYGKGVYGESTNGHGVVGKSTASDKAGVKGWNTQGMGVEGRSDNNNGVVGWTGASGDQDKSGVYGHSTNGRGVTGRSTGHHGVFGATFSSNSDHAGVFARNNGAGPGVYAEAGSNGYAAILKGNLLVRSASTGATVAELGEGLDYAEGFHVSEKTRIAPGTVLIIDPDNPGKLALSNKPYDTKVAGIVAGAKGLGSGVRLGAGRFDYDVALAGRVYCNVDAIYGEVSPGNLLTTAPTPGHAMVVKDYRKAQGAILGKAMEKLPEGKKGQILVLVTLQ